MIERLPIGVIYSHTRQPLRRQRWKPRNGCEGGLARWFYL